jgi:hypothetical protein
MATDFEKASPALQKAVQDFKRDFNTVPAEWARLAALHIDNDEIYAMPMWGFVFMPDGTLAGMIERLLTHPVPEDATGIIEFAETNGLDLDESEMKLLALAASDDEDHADEIEKIRQNVIQAWHESEDALLASYGWQDVGTTGFIAREIDGNLVLGVNGAGYSFDEAHWMPLYLALGFKWHEKEEPAPAPKPKRAKRKATKAKARKRKAG